MLGYRPGRTLFIFLASSAALVFLVLTIVESERLFYNYVANHEPAPDLVKGTTLRSGLAGVLLSPTLLLCVVMFVIVVAATG